MKRFLVACCALQLLACGSPPPPLYVPPELSPISRLPVKGFTNWKPGKALAFGEYQAYREGSFGFRLVVAGRGSWLAQCTVPSEARNDLRCTMAPQTGDTTRSWRLVIHAVTGELPRGDLSGPNARVDVIGSNQVQGAPAVSGTRVPGYHVLASGRAVAAVDLIGEGAVWLDTGLASERRDAIAGAAVSLFLWDYYAYPRK